MTTRDAVAVTPSQARTRPSSSTARGGSPSASCRSSLRSPNGRRRPGGGAWAGPRTGVARRGRRRPGRGRPFDPPRHSRRGAARARRSCAVRGGRGAGGARPAGHRTAGGHARPSERFPAAPGARLLGAHCLGDGDAAGLPPDVRACGGPSRRDLGGCRARHRHGAGPGPGRPCVRRTGGGLGGPVVHAAPYRLRLLPVLPLPRTSPSCSAWAARRGSRRSRSGWCSHIAPTCARPCWRAGRHVSPGRRPTTRQGRTGRPCSWRAMSAGPAVDVCEHRNPDWGAWRRRSTRGRAPPGTGARCYGAGQSCRSGPRRTSPQQ